MESSSFRTHEQENRVWEFFHPDMDLVNRLMDEASVSRPIGLVLAARGVTPETVQNFLHPEMENLGDPYLLPGTKDAARRLWEAIQKNQRIMIHGTMTRTGSRPRPFLPGCCGRTGRRSAATFPTG